MADKKIIKFEIVTPERTVLKQDILQVTLPTQSEITILPDLDPGFGRPGVLEIKTADQETEIMSVSGGFIEVLRDKVVILADTAERAQELDESLLEKARQQAEEAKAEAMAHEGYDLSAVAAKLETELARERALHKWRRLKK